MPKAPDFQPLEAAEFALVGEYLSSSLGVIMMAGHQKDAANLSDAAGNTYCFYPVSEVNGSYELFFYFGPSGLPQAPHAQLPTSYMILFDVAKSEWMLLAGAVVRSLVAAGGQHVVAVGNGWVRMTLNAAWAKTQAFAKVGKPDAKKFSDIRKKKLAKPEDFVHLHVHSQFSILDGFAPVERLAIRAVELGHKAIALTDHGYMFGTWKFFQACKEHGIKPILGVEAYVVDDVGYKYLDPQGNVRRFEYHQTLIAMNDEGWENLCTLLSIGCRDHYYHVPRIDHKMLLERNAGIICLSGCFKGMLAHWLQTRAVREGETELPWWLKRDVDRAVQYVRAYKAAFGDRYYGEAMNIEFKQYNDIVPEIVGIARSEGMKLAITNDVHYELGEEAYLQAMMAQIGGFGVGDGIGSQRTKTGPHYLKQRSELEGGIFTADMFDNTCEIADRVNLDISFKGYLFPEYDVTKDADWVKYQEEASCANRNS